MKFKISHEKPFKNENNYVYVVKCDNNKIWYWNNKLFMCERFIKKRNYEKTI